MVNKISLNLKSKKPLCIYNNSRILDDEVGNEDLLNLIKFINQNKWALDKPQTHNYKIVGKREKSLFDVGILGLGRLVGLKIYSMKESELEKFDIETVEIIRKYLDARTLYGLDLENLTEEEYEQNLTTRTSIVPHFTIKQLKGLGYKYIDETNTKKYNLEFFKMDYSENVLVRFTNRKDKKHLGCFIITNPKKLRYKTKETKKDRYNSTIVDIEFKDKSITLYFKISNSVGKDKIYSYTLENNPYIPFRPNMVYIREVISKFEEEGFFDFEFLYLRSFNKECKGKGQLRLVSLLVNTFNTKREDIEKLYKLSKPKFKKKLKRMLLNKKVTIEINSNGILCGIVPIKYTKGNVIHINRQTRMNKTNSGFNLVFDSMADYLLWNLIDIKLIDFEKNLLKRISNYNWWKSEEEWDAFIHNRKPKLGRKNYRKYIGE